MNPTFYYLLHVFSLLVLTAHTYMAFASPDPVNKKTRTDASRSGSKIRAQFSGCYCFGGGVKYGWNVYGSPLISRHVCCCCGVRTTR